MSKNIEDFDLDSQEGVDAMLDYFDQRPWLKDEYQRQHPKNESWDDMLERKGYERSDDEDTDDQDDVTGDPEPSSPDPDGDDDPDEDEDDDEDPEDEDYSDLDIAALRAEIDKRNADREDDEHISKGGSAQDLRDRLVEDDDSDTEE